MDSAPSSSTSPAPGTSSSPWRHWRRLGFSFLTVSIIAHLLLGVVATYFVVQTISNRKQTFKGPPPSSDAPAHAQEHKVQMQKRQQTMSAPASKRITTTGNVKVALPVMPAMMKMDAAIVPTAMTGMGGVGLGFGLGGSKGGGSGGGNGLNLFGLHEGKGLKGSFYDLKQTSSKTPTGINDVGKFVHELDQFLRGGWSDGFLGRYFKAPTSLSATQIFVPRTPSEEAPKAFGVEKEVQPSLWMALYKGQVSPPESGVYHFVGGGDNILIVRVNGAVVLDRSWNYQKLFGIDKTWKPVADYNYGFADIPNGFAKGQGVEMNSGEFYDMQVLLGDDGGSTHFSLLVEKDGATYTKTGNGLPILPLFRTSADPPPPGEHPPFQPDGPIWRSRPAVVSAF